MFRWQNALLHHFYLKNIIKYNLSPPPSPHTHTLLQLSCFVFFFFTYKEDCDTRITSSDPDIWEYRLNAELILFKLPSGRSSNSSLARPKVKRKNEKTVCRLKRLIKYDCKNLISDMDVIFFLFLRISNEHIDVSFPWLKEVIESIFNFCLLNCWSKEIENLEP